MPPIPVPDQALHGSMPQQLAAGEAPLASSAPNTMAPCLLSPSFHCTAAYQRDARHAPSPNTCITTPCSRRAGEQRHCKGPITLHNKRWQAYRRKCCKPTVMLLAHHLPVPIRTPSSPRHCCKPPRLGPDDHSSRREARPPRSALARLLPTQGPHHLDLQHRDDMLASKDSASRLCRFLYTYKPNTIPVDGAWDFLEHATGMHEFRSMMAYDQSQALTATPLRTPHRTYATDCQMRVR